MVRCPSKAGVSRLVDTLLKIIGVVFLLLPAIVMVVIDYAPAEPLVRGGETTFIVVAPGYEVANAVERHSIPILEWIFGSAYTVNSTDNVTIIGEGGAYKTVDSIMYPTVKFYKIRYLLTGIVLYLISALIMAYLLYALEIPASMWALVGALAPISYGLALLALYVLADTGGVISPYPFIHVLATFIAFVVIVATVPRAALCVLSQNNSNSHD